MLRTQGWCWTPRALTRLVPAGSAPGRPHGVYSCFIPASSGRVNYNGDDAGGDVALEMRGDKQSSTACLAWSETWVHP